MVQKIDALFRKERAINYLIKSCDKTQVSNNFAATFQAYSLQNTFILVLNSNFQHIKSTV